MNKYKCLRCENIEDTLHKARCHQIEMHGNYEMKSHIAGFRYE